MYLNFTERNLIANRRSAVCIPPNNAQKNQMARGNFTAETKNAEPRLLMAQLGDLVLLCGQHGHATVESLKENSAGLSSWRSLSIANAAHEWLGPA